MLVADMTTYFMQFVINHKECEQTLQLNEIYSFTENKVKSQSFSPEATQAEMSQALLKIDPSLSFMLLILNMTYG